MLTLPTTSRAVTPLMLCLMASLTLIVSFVTGARPVAAQTRSFVEFESGQVRPVAMTPDGSKLLAVNTPDNRLEVFAVSSGALIHTDSIPVGMEPVAVAAELLGRHGGRTVPWSAHAEAAC